MLKLILLIGIFVGTFQIIPVTIADAPVRTLKEYSPRELVQHYFPQNADVMTAIFTAESGMNPKGKNWNCRYMKADGSHYSTNCKTVEDRKFAWSVDCGIAQVNTKGQICPTELLDPIHNLEIAAAILDKQGLGAWSVYTNGTYKKYL